MDFTYNTIQGMFKIKDGRVLVVGIINDNVKEGKMKYLACAPTERRMSLSGSGLPYANPMIAFDQTPSKGDIFLGSDNSFKISILMPGSFYSYLGSKFMGPCVFIKYNNGSSEIVTEIPITNPVPYRSLTHPSRFTRPRINADFYDNRNLPVRSQERILIDSAYPEINKMADNFWGLKPPQ